MKCPKSQLLLLIALAPVASCGECKAASTHVAKEDGSAELCDSENSLLQNKFHNSLTLVEEEGTEEEGTEETGAREEDIADEEEPADPEEEEPAEPEFDEASLSEVNASKYPEGYLGRTDICFMIVPRHWGSCLPTKDPALCPEAIKSVALNWKNSWFVMKDDASGNSCTQAKVQHSKWPYQMRCKCGKGVDCLNGKCLAAAKSTKGWNAAVVNRLCEGNEVGKTDAAASAMQCKIKCEQISGCVGFNKIKKGPDRGKCSFFSTYECHRNHCECKQDSSANIYTIVMSDRQ